jgi:hypothetical protein
MRSINRQRSVQSRQLNQRASFHMQSKDARSQISTPVGQTSRHRTLAQNLSEKSTLVLS